MLIHKQEHKHRSTLDQAEGLDHMCIVYKERRKYVVDNGYIQDIVLQHRLINRVRA